MENIEFIITKDQAIDICNHYDKNANELESWEICELLDKLIDDALFGHGVMR